MAKRRQCIVEGCLNVAHARGYCRKHYGQIWRKGKINSDTASIIEEAAEPEFVSEDTDRMRALERELRKAEHMYQNVVGFEGRLKWRKHLGSLR